MDNYYCVITKEDNVYMVDFPDFGGNCFTYGDTLEEAVAMAEDVLFVMLEGETDVPAPSSLKAIQSQTKEGDSILLITPQIKKFDRAC
ncbi:type II toxin-antitoxin system HicB family antitoxin [Rummeliibacillus stabekisii]|uniref:type II toxin-antitoxin system HicB family antitoxin n=1 Tax=Rummeliibacillus stabekisii TaxID=241244 RepID=UPI0037187AE0